jgi:hypothetical protein
MSGGKQVSLLTLVNTKFNFGLRLKQHVRCEATNLAKIARRKLAW